MKRYLLFIVMAAVATTFSAQVVHPRIGTTVRSDDGRVALTLIGKKIAYSSADPDTYDPDIHSPKSVNVHPSGKKFYVNSLEGAKTVAYAMDGFRKLAVINHKFDEKRDAALWSKPSGLYPFTHYVNRGIALNTFFGKPVESTFSHGGKYLWVPYYRRNYDINAQDPSAVAIIDTETDKIVRLMETGPLPKMIATSPDGHWVAIAHWGNNTVGLIDISSPDPHQWHHAKVLIVDHQLDLNYSLTTPVDRDNGSGYALRGTVFTPDGHYLLVGCMGGGGGIAVIDLQRGEYMGRMLGMMANVRHLVIKNGYLYLSINGGGYVQRIELDKFISAARQMKNKKGEITGWTNCKVGTGARTIELSPSGKYIFAACNNSSALYVVDAKEMKVITHISVDSYPVGLDISKDGRYIFTTSQGRSGGGGNAVNIFRVDYNK